MLNKREVGHAIRHITRENVLEAIQILDRDPTDGGFKFNQRRYDLIIDGRVYAQRPIVAYAIKLALGLDEIPHKFGGTNDGKGITKLTELGFEVLPRDGQQFGATKRATPTFKKNKQYSRKGDIHKTFGGQQQSGISTPKDSQYIFLFTSESGEQFGYEDHWDEDGVFHYVGEGQIGDMVFQKGNKAIRDHAHNGKELLLFEALGKGEPVAYVGSFQCANWDRQPGLDKDGNQRSLIVFHLVPIESEFPELEIDEPLAPGQSIADLRKKAYDAADESPKGKSKWAQRTYKKKANQLKTTFW
jgi:5-methylcytosine-specific restriction protein A